MLIKSVCFSFLPCFVNHADVCWFLGELGCWKLAAEQAGGECLNFVDVLPRTGTLFFFSEWFNKTSEGK